MKARIESRLGNNVVVLYSEIPQSFVEGQINIIGGFDLLSKEELEQYGFYDVIEPVLPSGKMYGVVLYDDVANTFTYSIVDMPTQPIQIKKAILTKYEFLSRFTMAEKVAIYNLENSNVYIKIWLDTFRLCEEIDLNNTDVIAGLQLMKTLDILTDSRINEILL